MVSNLLKTVSLLVARRAYMLKLWTAVHAQSDLLEPDIYLRSPLKKRVKCELPGTHDAGGAMVGTNMHRRIFDKHLVLALRAVYLDFRR